jgi:hypothetical protein
MPQNAAKCSRLCIALRQRAVGAKFQLFSMSGRSVLPDSTDPLKLHSNDTNTRLRGGGARHDIRLIFLSRTILPIIPLG